MVVIHGDPSKHGLGKAICEALELDSSQVFAITLSFKAGWIANATVEQYITSEETGKIEIVMREYKIVPIEEDSNDSKGEMSSLP